MKILAKCILIITLSFNCLIAVGQKYEENDVDEFYEKVELDNGTLNERGESIDFVFVLSESVKPDKFFDQPLPSR